MILTNSTKYFIFKIGISLQKLKRDQIQRAMLVLSSSNYLFPGKFGEGHYAWKGDLFKGILEREGPFRIASQ